MLIHTIDSELQDIRSRDAESADTSLANRDRRRLLQLLDSFIEDANMDEKTVDSTSDARVVNNVMRHEYRVLSEPEKTHMRQLKDGGLELIAMLHDVGGTSAEFASRGAEAKQASRELSLAQTKIEEAVMWAVKHITR